MAIRTPVAIRAHAGGVTVTVLRYAESGKYESGKYVHDFASSLVASLQATLEAAQVEADIAIRVAGHDCDIGCTSWRLLD